MNKRSNFQNALDIKGIPAFFNPFFTQSNHNLFHFFGAIPPPN